MRPMDELIVPVICLEGLHLLVTRPEAQARPWAEKLQALGARVTLQPMMSIEPLDDATSKQQIINRVLAFAEYQKAIFISQNAVIHGLPWLDQYWPQLPIDTTFFAIGTATARLLDDGLQHDYSAHTTTSAMNSEALLSHAGLQSIEHEKILIFRGKGGRDFLAEQLRARGALVDYCELYERQCPNPVETALDPAYRHTTEQPIVVVHSGETLHNLCSNIAADDLLWLQQQAILLPGQRVADQADKAGFKKRIVAENATHDSMIDALNEWQKI